MQQPINPQQYSQQAGPPPGPSDPYGSLEAQVPLVGPVLATALRALDTYSNAVPRRIFGGLLALPGISDLLLSGTGDAEKSNIQDTARTPTAGLDNLLQARNEYWQGSGAAHLPFGGLLEAGSDIATDPLMGLGPISKLGAPIRALLGGGAKAGLIAAGGRFAEGVKASDIATHGLQAIQSAGNAAAGIAPGSYEAYKVLPQDTRVMPLMWHAVQNTGSIFNTALGGVPLELARFMSDKSGVSNLLANPETGLLAPSNSTRTRELSANLSNVLSKIAHQGQIQHPGAQLMDIVDGFQPLKDNPQALKDVMQTGPTGTGWMLSDNEAQTWANEYSSIQRAATSARGTIGSSLNAGAQLLRAINPGTDLPDLTARGAQTTANFKLVRDALNSAGITNLQDLANGIKNQWGAGSSTATDLLANLQTANKFRVNPLDPVSDTSTVISHAASDLQTAMQKTGSNLPDNLQPIARTIRLVGDIQRAQALAYPGYFVAENLWRAVQTMWDGGDATLGKKVFTDTLNAYGKVFKGTMNALPEHEQKAMLAPDDLHAITGALGWEFPRSIETPAINTQMMDEGQAASQSILGRLGLAYPALTGILGATSAFPSINPASYLFKGLSGVAEGAIGQRFSNLTQSLESAGDLIGRSHVFARAAATSMHQQLPGFLDQAATMLAEPLTKTLQAQAMSDQGAKLTSALTDLAAGLRSNGLNSTSGFIDKIAARGDTSLTPGVRQALKGLIAKDGFSLAKDQPGSQLWDHIQASLHDAFSTNAPTGTIERTFESTLNPDELKNFMDAMQATNGIVSVPNMAKIAQLNMPGISDGHLADLSRLFANVHDTAQAAATKASDTVNIFPRTTNLDEKLKYVLLFHNWAVRELPWFGEQMMQHPTYAASILKQMDNAQQEAYQRGLPSRFDSASAIIHPDTFMLGGLLKSLMGTPAQAFFNPAEVIQSPVAGMAESKAEGGMNTLADTLNMAGDLGLQPVAVANWLMYLTGVMGQDAPSPNFFRMGAAFRSLPGGFDTDLEKQPRALTDAVRRMLGQNPGNYEDYDARKIVREDAADAGMRPNSPQTAAMEANPLTPEYQSALGQAKHENLFDAIVGLLDPVPGGLETMTQREADVRGSRAQLNRDAGLREDVAGLFAPALDAAAPNTTTLRGLSLARPTVPALQTVLANSYGDKTTDPRVLLQQYLTWAQTNGVAPDKVWDRWTIREFFNESERNRMYQQMVSGGQPIRPAP